MPHVKEAPLPWFLRVHLPPFLWQHRSPPPDSSLRLRHHRQKCDGEAACKADASADPDLVYVWGIVCHMWRNTSPKRVTVDHVWEKRALQGYLRAIQERTIITPKSPLRFSCSWNNESFCESNGSCGNWSGVSYVKDSQFMQQNMKVIVKVIQVWGCIQKIDYSEHCKIDNEYETVPGRNLLAH